MPHLRLFSSKTVAPDSTQYQQPKKINKMNQVKAYKADPKISLVIKSNASDLKNRDDKELYNKQIRECALGLYKNYKKNTKS